MHIASAKDKRHSNKNLKSKDFCPMTESSTPLKVQLFLYLHITHIRYQGSNIPNKGATMIVGTSKN